MGHDFSVTKVWFGSISNVAAAQTAIPHDDHQAEEQQRAARRGGEHQPDASSRPESPSINAVAARRPSVVHHAQRNGAGRFRPRLWRRVHDHEAARRGPGCRRPTFGGLQPVRRRSPRPCASGRPQRTSTGSMVTSCRTPRTPSKIREARRVTCWRRFSRTACSAWRPTRTTRRSRSAQPDGARGKVRHRRGHPTSRMR